MAVSFSRILLASGLSLCIGWGLGEGPGPGCCSLPAAGAETEAIAPQEALIQAHQQWEQAVNFLENETGAIWLLQQSFANLERNTIYELMTLAPAYGLIGFPQEGLALVERALALPDVDIYRATLRADQAVLSRQVGEYGAAVEAAQQSLDAAYQLEALYDTVDTYGVAHGLYQLGHSYLMQGAVDQAVTTLNASLEAMDPFDHHPALAAQTLYALSLAYQAQGEVAKAEQAALAALAIRRNVAELQGWDLNSLDPGESIDPWDHTLLRVGDAIADMQAAITTYEQLHEVTAEVEARRYLGNLYQQIGLLDQAQAQFNLVEAHLGRQL